MVSISEVAFASRLLGGEVDVYLLYIRDKYLSGRLIETPVKRSRVFVVRTA